MVAQASWRIAISKVPTPSITPRSSEAATDFRGRRHNHDNLHVRSFRDEGTTTTPFDLVVLNNLDRYQLSLDAIQRIPRFSDQVKMATSRYWTSMERHKLYNSEHGDDMPEVRDWRWSA
jgi:xylulose-5-phosphate/fructose-6-phosphate phosphoketolase